MRTERNGLGNPVLTTEGVGGWYWNNEGIFTEYGSIQNETKFNHAGQVTLRYDAQGVENDQKTIYTRNGFGEIAMVKRPDDFTKTMSLDKRGSITGINYSDGRDITMDLDTFDRPVGIRENGTLTQEFDYYANGMLKQATDTNAGNDDVVVNRTWDTLVVCPSSLVVCPPSPTALADELYFMDIKDLVFHRCSAP